MRNERAGVVIAGRGAWPAEVEVVRRRFELWRRTQTGRSRIPEDLWASAVKLAAVHGTCPTAQALRLNYTALKDHVEAADPRDHQAPKRVGSMDRDSPPAQRTPARTMPIRSAPAPEHLPATPRMARPPQQKPAMTFVELSPAERLGQPECRIELEHPLGAKMRIHLTGSPSPEVVTALSAAFFRAEASFS